MNLFLLRHASAGVRRTNPLLDVKRPLDRDGKTHCLHLAALLNALKTNFDLVVSSPLKRSQQTAQLVATETGYEQHILISNALLPTATYAQFQSLLRDCAAYENVLVVGHNPTITTFLGQLVGALPTPGPVPTPGPLPGIDPTGNPGSNPSGDPGSGFTGGPAGGPGSDLTGASSGGPGSRGGDARIRLRKGSLARVSLQRGSAVLQSLLDPRIVRSAYATSTKSSRRKISRK